MQSNVFVKTLFTSCIYLSYEQFNQKVSFHLNHGQRLIEVKLSSFLQQKKQKFDKSQKYMQILWSRFLMSYPLNYLSNTLRGQWLEVLFCCLSSSLLQDVFKQVQQSYKLYFCIMSASYNRNHLAVTCRFVTLKCKYIVFFCFHFKTANTDRMLWDQYWISDMILNNSI